MASVFPETARQDSSSPETPKNSAQAYISFFPATWSAPVIRWNSEILDRPFAGNFVQAACAPEVSPCMCKRMALRFATDLIGWAVEHSTANRQHNTRTLMLEPWCPRLYGRASIIHPVKPSHSSWAIRLCVTRCASNSWKPSDISRLTQNSRP